MNCHNHPTKEANGICVKCGKPMCAECLVDIGGKNYCKNCLKSTNNLDETPNVVINNTNKNGGILDGLSSGVEWCCCIIIIICVIIGISH